MLIDCIRREIIRVLDSHLSEMSGAVKNSLHVFAEKMFEKGFVSECVMSNPETFKKIITEFKADFCFIQKLEDLLSKINVFLNIFRDLGGPLKSAAERMDEEIKKAVELEIKRQKHSKSSSKIGGVMSVRDMDGNDSMCIGNLLQSGLFYSNPDNSAMPSRKTNTSDNEMMNSSFDAIGDDRNLYNSKDVAQNEDRTVISSQFTSISNSESHVGGSPRWDPQNPVVNGNRDMTTPMKSRPNNGRFDGLSVNQEEPLVQPSQQESGDDIKNQNIPVLPVPPVVKKKVSVKSASQEIEAESGPSYVPYYKHNSCPGCVELNCIKKKEKQDLKMELEKLKQKLTNIEEERNLEQERDREKARLRMKSLEEKFKNCKLEMIQRQGVLESKERQLTEERHKLQKDIELRKAEESSREVLFEMRRNELTNQEARLERKSSDIAQKRAENSSTELKVAELKLRLNKKEFELKEQEKSLREKRLELIDYREKEEQIVRERSCEVTTKWNLYWKENELFREREKSVWMTEAKLDEREQRLVNKEKHITCLCVVLSLLTVTSVLFFVASLTVTFYKKFI